MGIHHTAISTQDLGKTVRWYHQHLGFAEIKRVKRETKEIVLMELDGSLLEIFNCKNSKPQPEVEKDLQTDLEMTGVRHFGVVVENLSIKLAELAEQGIKVETKPKEPFYGGLYAFVKDCNGILVELVELPK